MDPVDSHVHAFSESQIRRRDDLAETDPTFAEMFQDGDARMVSIDAAERTLREQGFAGGLVSGFAFAHQADCDEQNESFLAAGNDARNLAVLASVNLALPGWEASARHNLELGAAGFGELRPVSQGWDPLGPQAARLYQMCREAGALVQWHVSEPVGHWYPGKLGGITAEGLCAVATEFPDLKQIAAHLGGGLAFFLQMPELRKPLANVWFDTAATSLLYDDRAVARVTDLAGSRRVLFGSDYPLLSPRRHLKRVLAVIPPDCAWDVCGGNLREMLGRQWK